MIGNDWDTALTVLENSENFKKFLTLVKWR